MLAVGGGRAGGAGAVDRGDLSQALGEERIIHRHAGQLLVFDPLHVRVLEALALGKAVTMQPRSLGGGQIDVDAVVGEAHEKPGAHDGACARSGA